MLTFYDFCHVLFLFCFLFRNIISVLNRIKTDILSELIWVQFDCERKKKAHWQAKSDDVSRSVFTLLYIPWESSSLLPPHLAPHQWKDEDSIKYRTHTYSIKSENKMVLSLDFIWLVSFIVQFTSVYIHTFALVGGTSRRRVSRHKREYLYIQVYLYNKIRVSWPIKQSPSVEFSDNDYYSPVSAT